MEHIKAPTLESRLSSQDLSWDDLLQLFRIHGAFMFGIGTFHGDLHPETLWSTKTVCSRSLILERFHTHRKRSFSIVWLLLLSCQRELEDAFEAMLTMADTPPTAK